MTVGPIIRPDFINNDGNLRATDIGITWAGSDTFLHGVKVVGPDVAGQPARPQPATSTPYQPVRYHGGCDLSTPRQPSTIPTCLEIPDTCTPLCRNAQEGRQGYRPAAQIQRFNNKSLNGTYIVCGEYRSCCGQNSGGSIQMECSGSRVKLKPKYNYGRAVFGSGHGVIYISHAVRYGTSMSSFMQ